MIRSGKLENKPRAVARNTLVAISGVAKFIKFILERPQEQTERSKFRYNTMLSMGSVNCHCMSKLLTLFDRGLLKGIRKKDDRLLKDRYCDSLSAIKAASVFRRKRKRFAV